MQHCKTNQFINTSKLLANLFETVSNTHRNGLKVHECISLLIPALVSCWQVVGFGKCQRRCFPTIGSKDIDKPNKRDLPQYDVAEITGLINVERRKWNRRERLFAQRRYVWIRRLCVCGCFVSGCHFSTAVTDRLKYKLNFLGANEMIISKVMGIFLHYIRFFLGVTKLYILTKKCVLHFLNSLSKL